MKPAILLVDDDPGIRFGFVRYLAKKGYDIVESACLADARETLASRRFDVLLLDLRLPDGSGLDWIPEARERCPDIALVVITGEGDITSAVEAMRRGADHYLTKPVDMAGLEVFIQKSLELEGLRRRETAHHRTQRAEAPYLGRSAAALKMGELVALAARSDAPLLLSGETGTGKGVLARWIHDRCPRDREPFVEVNCSSLRGELLLSELFGHVKGAFTSAFQDRQGLVEVADRGTLFLDEIGDMDLQTQAQFLKVIEEKSYRRVGEVKVRRSEFRLICATHRDLRSHIQSGAFRQDLYFRINVLPIDLPPLRERAIDIPGLIQRLLEDLGAPTAHLAPPALDALKRYPWPGNIRELKNVLERALLLAQGTVISLEHFAGLVAVPSLDPSGLSSPSNLARREMAIIRQVLDCCGGDTRKAAQELGISRATLYRKLKKS
jgi:DNA-binding NtrC family response regulator